MTALRAIIVSLALVATSHVAWGSEFPWLDSARTTISSRVSAWRRAAVEAKVIRDRHEALAHRIGALKRTGRVEGRAQPALEQLLRASLETERLLEAKNRTRQASAEAVAEIVDDSVRRIDAEIVRLKPGLRRGSRLARAASARRLKALITARGELKAQVTALATAAPAASRAWTSYEVTVEPLDGPQELRDKADFLEDTRDKFEKKRRALSQLIAQARQEREIARAAANFQTDLRHFDEEMRTGRVARRDSALGVTTTGGPTRTNERSQPPADERDSATEQSPGQLGGGEPNNATAGGTRADGDPSPGPMPTDVNTGIDSTGNGRVTAGGGGHAAPPSAPGAFAEADDDVASKTTPAPGASAGLDASPVIGFTGNLPRQVDPDILLNLDVADLEGAANLERLAALLGDLEQLDAFLQNQAGGIRALADQLEADETRTLGDN